MNDTKTKTDPLAAALAKLLDDSSACAEGYYNGSMRRLFVALQIDPSYRGNPERPHSVKALRDELDRRAVAFHRDLGIVLSIFDGAIEENGESEITIGWATKGKA